jgi:hypothetical protein
MNFNACLKLQNVSGNSGYNRRTFINGNATPKTARALWGIVLPRKNVSKPASSGIGNFIFLAVSLAPGFSPVAGKPREPSRFNGFAGVPRGDHAKNG